MCGCVCLCPAGRPCVVARLIILGGASASEHGALLEAIFEEQAQTCHPQSWCEGCDVGYAPSECAQILGHCLVLKASSVSASFIIGERVCGP